MNIDRAFGWFALGWGVVGAIAQIIVGNTDAAWWAGGYAAMAVAWLVRINQSPATGLEK